MKRMVEVMSLLSWRIFNNRVVEVMRIFNKRVVEMMSLLSWKR